MKFVKNLISRVRWNVVISIVAVIVLIIIAVLFFRPGAPHFECSNGVCIDSYAEPSEVSLKGDSTLWIDIKNRGDEDLIIDIKLETSKVLFFKETNSREISDEVELRPGESIKLNFDVKANASYPGTYRTDIMVAYNDERIDDEVYIKVS
ncbi:MAG: hypothetical protein B6U86_01985 [Candidatus Altiarchaeales archaeon ex4484_43]|nr:MAG: hypothetical protein B6U86_01985 [Candidatus Altiarchaeales archaeon ex4484_43]RLI90017.1 MAG: hypothetical protein DRO62_00155 [Candidatus Altiarchaeales archaeon]